MDIVLAAKELATHAHKHRSKTGQPQLRKYNNRDYIEHPAAVVRILEKAGYAAYHNVIAAAWLHDTLEDTTVTYHEIVKATDVVVANFVLELSDNPLSVGNRAYRKKLDNMRLAAAPWQVQTIKLADTIDNSHSIKEHDPDFWRVYRREKIDLLWGLKDGDENLWIKAMELVS